MGSVNVSFAQLAKGATLEEVATKVQALETAGLRVNLHIRETEDIQLLDKLATRPQVEPQPRRVPFAGLIFLGALSASAAIVFGWIGI